MPRITEVTDSDEDNEDEGEEGEEEDGTELTDSEEADAHDKGEEENEQCAVKEMPLACAVKEMPLASWLKGAERSLRLPQPGKARPCQCVRTLWIRILCEDLVGNPYQCVRILVDKLPEHQRPF